MHNAVVSSLSGCFSFIFNFVHVYNVYGCLGCNLNIVRYASSADYWKYTRGWCFSFDTSAGEFNLRHLCIGGSVSLTGGME